MPVLQISNLTLDYKTKSGNVHALERVNLQVDQSEFLGLVGESGSGKSTLAYTTIGLLPPNAKVIEGRVEFEGMQLLSMSEKELRKVRGKRISMVFQDPTTSLNPVFKVKDQVGRVIELQLGCDKKTALRTGIEYLRYVELPDPEQVMNSYPFELSGGMQQRVMIALALSLGPSLVIADEPTSAVDATIQAQILELMRRIRKENKFSMLFITHNLDVVGAVCDRIAVMYAGRVVETGPTSLVFSDPKHPYTKALFLSIPRPRRSPTEGRTLNVIPGSVPDMSNPPSGCKFHPRCPYAFDRCREEDPEMRRVGDNQWAACHLY